MLIRPGVTLPCVLIIPGTTPLAWESGWPLGHCADASRPKGGRPKSTVYRVS